MQKAKMEWRSGIIMQAGDRLLYDSLLLSSNDRVRTYQSQEIKYNFDVHAAQQLGFQ